MKPRTIFNTIIVLIIAFSPSIYADSKLCYGFYGPKPTLLTKGFESLGILDSYQYEIQRNHALSFLTKLGSDGKISATYGPNGLEFSIRSISNGILYFESLLSSSDQGLTTRLFLKAVIDDIKTKIQEKYGDDLVMTLANIRWQDEGNFIYAHEDRDTGVHRYHVDKGFIAVAITLEGIGTEFRYKDTYAVSLPGEAVIFNADRAVANGFGKPGVHRAIFESAPKRRLFIRVGFAPKP